MNRITQLSIFENNQLGDVCVNLFYAKFRNLTCTAYLEMF
jgi:hypothetical protein